jgi:hypothetical protein
MRRMRINLVTPFAEKDAAKALGARWDSAKKTWYVQDVADLTPFQRWIPAHADIPATGSASVAQQPARVATGASPTAPAKGTVTESVTVLAHCGCAALPWEPCAHTC